jgi:hypothetical protein
MSFDIIVLNLRRRVPLLADVTEADVEPLGTPAAIRQSCEKVFPQARWQNERRAILVGNDGASFEFAMADGVEPGSLHLTFRFGGTWDDAARAAFDSLMDRLWSECGWQAFSVSDNSALSRAVESA